MNNGNTKIAKYSKNPKFNVVPIYRKITTKNDVKKWLMEYYDEGVTHYDFINRLFERVMNFINCYNVTYDEQREKKFKAKFIMYLYNNSSHKKYQYI